MAYTNIDDSEANFQCVLWTGDGNDDRNITLPGTTDLQPNIVWVKGRSDDDSHRFYDSVRGATKYLNTATAGEEATGADGMQAFQSDGFQVGTDGSHNGNTKTYAGFCWKESTAGGLDIISYTGNGSARTISHNLGVVPKMMIVKCLDDGNKSFAVYHHGVASDPATDVLAFDTNDPLTDDATYWNDTDPTASVFTVGTANGVNKDTKSYIAYIFADVQGYQKIGSYTGNNNANGVYVWTGFRPAYLLVRAIDTSNWYMWNNKAAAGNQMSESLSANQTIVEENSREIDFFSNGFKAREARGSHNDSGAFVYYAVAEAPFVNSKGVAGCGR